MKRWFSILFLLVCFSSTLLSDVIYKSGYQINSYIFEDNFDKTDYKLTKEVFFGSFEDYQERLKEGLTEISLKGLEGALNGAASQSANLAKGFLNAAGDGMAAGMGIGLIIGGIDYYIKSSKASKQFMYVVEVEDKNGVKSRINYLITIMRFIYDKNYEDKHEEIKALIKKEVQL